MKLKLAQPTNHNSYAPPSLPSLTREERKVDFISTAIPAAIMGGIQAFGTGASHKAQWGAAAGAVAPGITSAYSPPFVATTASRGPSVMGGLWGAIDLAVNWGKSSPAAGSSSGMALGAMIGTFCCPGIGTAIGAGIGAIAGGLIGSITSGKHKDQRVRDQVRAGLVQMGIINSDYQLPLADGTMYDLGKDGGPRAEYGGRRPFEMDVQDPVVQQTANWIEPIMAILSQGNQKIRVDFTGYFTNAAISNAKDMNDVLRNVESFMSRFGLTNDSLANAVIQMAEAGMIEPHKAQAWFDGITQRMSLTGTQQSRSNRRTRFSDSDS